MFLLTLGLSLKEIGSLIKSVPVVAQVVEWSAGSTLQWGAGQDMEW